MTYEMVLDFQLKICVQQCNDHIVVFRSCVSVSVFVSVFMCVSLHVYVCMCQCLRLNYKYHILMGGFSELPDQMTTEIGDASLHLSFERCFSNLLHVDLYVTNHGQRTMKNCRFSVDIAGVCPIKYFVVSFSL